MTEPTRTLLLELRHPGRLGKVETTELRDGEPGFDEVMAEMGWVHVGSEGNCNPERENDTHEFGPDGRCVYCLRSKTNGHSVKVGETTGGPWCDAMYRGAHCTLMRGHHDEHVFRMLETAPVPAVGCDEPPKPGKLISERALEIATAREAALHPPNSCLIVTVTLTIQDLATALDERLGRG